MGDSVNAAWVFESANIRYRTKIIIDAETRRLAGEQVKIRTLNDLSLQGYNKDLPIFELLGLSNDNWIPPNWLRLYEAGLDAYRARNLSAAIEHFRMLLCINVSDSLRSSCLNAANFCSRHSPKTTVAICLELQGGDADNRSADVSNGRRGIDDVDPLVLHRGRSQAIVHITSTSPIARTGRGCPSEAGIHPRVRARHGPHPGSDLSIDPGGNR